MNGKVKADSNFCKDFKLHELILMLPKKIPNSYPIFKTMPQLEKEGAPEISKTFHKNAKNPECAALMVLHV